MTLKAYMDLVVERLSSLYPQQECKAVAVRMLKECISGYKGYEHLVEPGTDLGSFSLAGTFGAGSVEDFLLGAVERLSTGEPIQYILGYEWFCGNRFRVAPGVLIPRPETEELVREVVGNADVGAPLRVLDICTGSGCIAWSVAAQLPEAKVFGCDISDVALEVAREQDGMSAGADAKFFKCDILAEDALERIVQECGEEKFDIIVSNPPYVCESEKALMQRNVLDFEPDLALFVPDDDPLRFYRKIATLSGSLLGGEGKLFFEINERFGGETMQMMSLEGFEDCRIMRDIFGKDRFVAGVKKNAYIYNRL